MEVKANIIKIITDMFDIEDNEINLDQPPNNISADFSLSCFELANILNNSANKIALYIKQNFPKVNFITQLDTLGPYVNFYLNRELVSRNVISGIIKKKETYFSLNIGDNKKILFDYSSPNIAKPFHVGHLRSTIIGNALYNIFKTLGYNCVSINHLGDWGTQFGKLLYAYEHWGNKNIIKLNGIGELSKLYVKFHEVAQDNPELNDYAREYFLKMQSGDKKILETWHWFNEISLNEFKNIYKRLGINFDYYIGESFYNDKTQNVVKLLEEKKLLSNSQGATIVNLESYNMPPCLILRSDGGSLYATRDIAAAIYRHEKFNFDKCIYITGFDQKLHFKQWFKVIELMGYSWAKDLVHITFGLINLKTGKLSTRKGNVILMEDLLDQAVEKTKNIIQTKNQDLSQDDIKEIAETVGVGAIIFDDIYSSRVKDINFSWDRILNFDGETGPYVQYTYVRTWSILRKATDITELNDTKFDIHIDYSILSDDSAFAVIKLLALFTDKIIESANKYEPYVISRHLIKISQAFNKFYHDDVVISTEYKIKLARLSLVKCVNITLEFGLKLLGIKVSKVM
jgi:arginyl-tRNA synthetase